MSILYYFVGAVLLVAGRKLYWFFTAAVGMIAGILLSGILLDAENMTWRTIFAVVGAVLGAILAVALQKIAIGIVGFVAGGLGAIFLWRILELPEEGRMLLLPFILGGIIAAVLVILAFEYGLIILTSWGGATLISRELSATSQEIDFNGWVGAAVLFGLLLAGVVIQAVALTAERKKERADNEGTK